MTIELRSIKTFLFDYDNTLVTLDEKAFSEAFFIEMHKYFPEIEFKLFSKASIESTRAMIESDGTKLLSEVYEDKFSEIIPNFPREKILSTIIDFYKTDFTKLKKFIKVNEKAIFTIKKLLVSEKEVVIATNPILGHPAQQVRLKWLNLDEDKVLITSANEYNFAKPRVEYYQQLIDTLQRKPEAMLMIGDRLTHDITPAKACGIKTYYIENNTINNISFGEQNLEIKHEPDEKGTIEDLCDRILKLLEEEQKIKEEQKKEEK